MRECLLPMMATFFDYVNSWTWTFCSPKYLVAFGLLTFCRCVVGSFSFFFPPSYYIIDCAVCLCHDGIKKKEKATIRKSSCNLSLSTLTFLFVVIRWTRGSHLRWCGCGLFASSLRPLVAIAGEDHHHDLSWCWSTQHLIFHFFFPQLVILSFLFSNLLNLAQASVVCRSSPWGFASQKGDTNSYLGTGCRHRQKDKTFSSSKFRCFSRFFFDSFWFRLPTNQERWIFLS